MWKPNRILGFEPCGFPALLGSRIPWTRPGYKVRGEDPRISNPSLGGGRRMIHPFLEDIIYPENPTRTPGFDYDVLPTMRSVLTRTEGGTSLARYPDKPDDVVITEIWDAGGDLKVSVEFYRALYQYLMTPVPTGDYIGWQPRDKSPYNYFIELIDVKIGSRDQYNVDEVGSEEPYMLTEPLVVIFKLVQAVKAPSGVLVFLGI